MSRLTERYKEKVFCKADCSEMIDYAEDCECPHLQKMKEKSVVYIGFLIFNIVRISKQLAEFEEEEMEK